MNTTTLVKWGNGQGIRLSKSVTEEAGFHIGDTLEVEVRDGKLTIAPARRRYIGILDYEKLFEGYDGPRPAEDGFARPMGREFI